MSAITIDQVRAACRERSGRISATRLGYVAAELGADIEINPYGAGSRGYHSFVRAFLLKRDALAVRS